MKMTDDERADEARLAHRLQDAAAGFAWTALVGMGVVWISYAVYLLERGTAPGLVTHMWGVPPATAAKIWVGALAATKLLALWFAGVAFALWVWRNRVVRRLG
jgi:hypothetical protein